MSSCPRVKSVIFSCALLGAAACGGDGATTSPDGSLDSPLAADAGPTDVAAGRDATRPDSGKSEAGMPHGGRDSGFDAAHDASGRDVAPGLDASPARESGVDSATDARAEASADSGLDAATDAMGSTPATVGAACAVDTDCVSQLCKPVVLGVGPVCVTACAAQADCVPSTGFFCEPVAAGSSAGYCIPQSPAHCLACTQDSDCGSLSEVCFEAPGDSALSCNIDCSLSGAAACPSDYSCVSETVSGAARMLCRPTGIPACVDALGGFCDRLMVAQPCARDDQSGSCVGQRTCMVDARYSDCNAATPQCKVDCSVADPAGCTEAFCAGAVDTPTNCGTCGTVCPGYMLPSDNVACQAGTTCTFSCQGESYDVDGSEANGCEVTDAPEGNHTEATAAVEAAESDCDATFSFGGKLVSDARVHELPAVVGFDAASGSAPDWYSFEGVGNSFCQNDLVFTLTMTGSTSPGCYRFTVITDKETYTCTTDATGTCGIDYLDGQFSDNTTIYAEVSKVCGTTVTESVAYTVSGHL